MVLKLSVSEVKLALKCGRLFLFGKKYKETTWMPEKKTGFPTGRIVHEILDDFAKKSRKSPEFITQLKESSDYSSLKSNINDFILKSFLQKIEPIQAKIKSGTEVERAWTILETAINLISKVLSDSLEMYAIEEALEKVFFMTEWSFEIPIFKDEIHLTGKIDWLSYNPKEKKIYLWDFKTTDTGNIHLDAIQVALYSFVIKDKIGFFPESALLYFSDNDLKIVSFTKENLEPLTQIAFEKMKEAKNWLEGTIVPEPTKDKNLCEKCIKKIRCDEFFQSFATSNLLKTATVHSESKPLAEEIIKDGSSIIPTRQPFYIGETAEGSKMLIDPQIFIRHAAIMGASGSGKTVLAKVLIEEGLLQEYSYLIIDPQGDLCSLIISNDELGKKIVNRTHFKIFTPGSKKGIKLSLNPLKLPDPRILEDEDYKIVLLDNISTLILTILGYNFARKIPVEKTFLEIILKLAWEKRVELNFSTLSQLILSTEKIEGISIKETISTDSLISPKNRQKLAQEILKLGMGTEGTLFLEGESLNIDELVSNHPSCYIINLASIGTDVNKRQLVLSWIIRLVYDWILLNPQESQEHIRFFFYIDEVADFLPPNPYFPPAKSMLLRLLRQARKYGCACIIATQSPGSIDYKALDNISTFFIGRIPSKQSIQKIEALLRPFNVLPTQLNLCRSAAPGTFLTNYSSKSSIQLFKTRWLHTKHQTLSLEQISSCIGQR